MIDVHSHVLYGLDDGARTLEDSVAMLRMAAADGTTDIVASPHANLEFTFDAAVVEQRLAEVQAAVGDSIRVHYGCDFHLTMDNIQDALSHPGKYSICHNGYLLVEFADFAIPKATTEIFSRMLSGGLRPIITHPERNPLLQRRIADLESWVSMGCLLQVTSGSWSGRFGRQAETTVVDLMRRGLVHVVASDAHDCRHRPPVLQSAHRDLAAEYGIETADLLFKEHPAAILAGAKLPAGPLPIRRRKKWYQFL
jgi:protein-tyrosine phosphatase